MSIEPRFFCEVKDGKKVTYFFNDVGEKVYPPDTFVHAGTSQPPTPVILVRVEGKERVVFFQDGEKEVIISREKIVMPSLVQQAKNFTRSMVSWAKEGFPLSKEQSERWAICEVCPDLISGRCRHCGCGMKRKIQLDTARCDLRKW